MGACCCGDAQTSKVNSELKDAKKMDKFVKKLLFLGSGGSGKSTLFKQLRTIHGDGYENEDRMAFVTHIHAQIIEQMKLAIECVEDLGHEYSESYDGTNNENNNENNNYNNNIKNNNINAQPEQKQQHRGLNELSENARLAVDIVFAVKDPRITQSIAESIKILWNEPEIKSIYDQRATMKIEDTSAYFWDSIDRVMTPGFIPSENDILFVRFRTTGVIEQSFTIKDNVFNVFDVGGQKSERKKWINCFDHVTAVIFVASLSCYDEAMFEQEDINSMVDSLDLFGEICNERCFLLTSMILFLNKTDLYVDKILSVPITVCPAFADFKEENPTLNINSYDDTTAYIKEKFTDKNVGNKNIFCHLTCATDKGNVSKVFNDVQHIIIENSLMSAGLMGETEDDDDMI